MYDPIEIARQYAPKFDKPVVDMVEVVRCKDCKHWAMHSWCSRLAPFDKVYMGADDYCSKGKRRDELE